jgi:hypothetical protein
MANMHRYTLPSVIVKAYDKTMLLEDILSERRSTFNMADGNPAPRNVVKTMSTKANRLLQGLLKEYTKGNEQEALKLMQELGAQDSILQMVKDNDDYALQFRKVSNPKEYQAVMDYLDQDN